MRERYLALYWGERSALEPIAERITSQARSSGLQVVFQAAGLRVLASPNVHVETLAFGGGVILGAVYSQESQSAAVSTVTPDWSMRVRKTCGRTLITDCWGRYVLFAKTPEEDALTVLRDPSGFLPAYSLQIEGLQVIASDVDDLFPSDVATPRIDWDFVAHFLAFPDLRGAATGLMDVSDLIPGVAYRFGEHPSASVLWDPWSFTSPGQPPAGFPAACEQLFETVAFCTQRLLAPYTSVLLELSGGLDSSILAAMLSRIETRSSAVTLVTAQADGDERRYARLAAAKSSLALDERLISAEGTDLVGTRPRGRVRPGATSIVQTSEAAFAEALRNVGAQAFVSGTGGDNVFCALKTAAPATDALKAFGPGKTMLAALNDLSRLHGCTIWTAARSALKKTVRPPVLWRRETDFLNLDHIPERPLDHPWFRAPSAALPGQREHVAMLIGSHAYLDSYRRLDAAPMVFPLLSQPVMELCLSIPSWMWIVGGRDRAVARQAFSGVLPPEVVHRRSKGRLDSLAGDLFKGHRDQLRELLLYGLLAEHGLLDTALIARSLDTPGSSRDSDQYRLLQCANVEVWVRSWSVAR